jgi:NDP-sugar pyrophosphorylase family protein
MNIVIPMAGAGSRFAKAGYPDPKPLIKINGVPMIQLVIENIRPKTPHRFIFICQKSHLAAYDLEEKLAMWAPGSITIGISGLTDGAACTVLKARELIDVDRPLMIANSDQYLDVDIDKYLMQMGGGAKNLDGLIMTMHANDPKWSFVGLDEANLVTTVVEKEVVSNEATVGIYNFKHGTDFVNAADEMINLNLRVNNEFYVAPVYNQLIKIKKSIGIYNIGKIGAGMHGLGTPDDLDSFLKHPISKKVPQFI